MILVARAVLRWQLRPGSRAVSRAAMEVAFRGVRKILCVAEKNDAAKGIADLLSGGRMRRVRRRPGLPGPRQRHRRRLLPAGSAKLCSRLRLRGSLPNRGCLSVWSGMQAPRIPWKTFSFLLLRRSGSQTRQIWETRGTGWPMG